MGSYWSSLGPDLGREQNQVYSEGNSIHMDMGGFTIHEWNKDIWKDRLRPEPCGLFW